MHAFYMHAFYMYAFYMYTFYMYALRSMHTLYALQGQLH